MRTTKTRSILLLLLLAVALTAVSIQTALAQNVDDPQPRGISVSSEDLQSDDPGQDLFDPWILLASLIVTAGMLELGTTALL